MVRLEFAMSPVTVLVLGLSAGTFSHWDRVIKELVSPYLRVPGRSPVLGLLFW